MKPLAELTFEELVVRCQALIRRGVSDQQFATAVFNACDLTLQWKQERDKYLNSIRMEEPK